MKDNALETLIELHDDLKNGRYARDDYPMQSMIDQLDVVIDGIRNTDGTQALKALRDRIQQGPDTTYIHIKYILSLVNILIDSNALASKGTSP